MVQQGVGQRAIPIAAARVNHEACGLVYDDDRGVFVHDRKGNRLRHERARARIGERPHDDALAAVHASCCFDVRARERHAARVDPGANPAARMLRQQARQRLIQSHPTTRGGDVDDHRPGLRIVPGGWVIIIGYQWSGQ